MGAILDNKTHKVNLHRLCVVETNVTLKESGQNLHTPETGEEVSPKK